jgi:DNA-binding Lrp family transcriptional regulator
VSTKVLEKLMGTATKIDLLRIFNNEPFFCGTPKELARRIGRSPSEVQSAIEDFIDLGIVKRQEVYSLCVENYRNIQDAIAKRIGCGGITG